MEIKKAIMAIAGSGTRFLPMSKVLSKEFFPIIDKPLIQYIVQEAKDAGIEEIIFVISPGQKMIADYIKPDKRLEAFLSQRKKDKQLKDLKDIDDVFGDLKINFVVQKEPNGDGHAILQAKKFIGADEAVAVLHCDDIIDSDEPAIAQLIKVFQTCNSPVLGLKQLPKESLPAYGVVANEKIANGLHKIKKIIEKPTFDQAPSNLVVVGKYILTPEVFSYLKKAKPSKKGEIFLAEVFDKMLSDGKVIYGSELRGEWLECGDKLKWIKSFFYFALKDPRYKEELKKYLKTIK
ncbi:MAG: UTP--glucose-1-phosphate uridylyltransferase [Candidatus Staskawiczbacteria bacterium]|jgi:UTP--glucose-1-phosphate uridylyltransferase